MLVLSVATNNYNDALQQIINARTKPIDVIELRLDYFKQLNKTAIQKLMTACQCPIVFTLRKFDQGGKYDGPEEQRLKIIMDFLSLKPNYLDIEYDVPKEYMEKLKTKSPKTEFICSYHNFEQTPDNLLEILQAMQCSSFSIYKIATFAHSTLDSLRMLNFVREMTPAVKLAGMCMGECGSVTRILAPLVNSALTYTFLPKTISSALGQIGIDELTKIFRYQQLSPETKIYALLGDPVEQSIGHLFHNDQFEKYRQDAIYVKLKLKADELKMFFTLSKKLPFRGFSVTMPLKEEVVPYVSIMSEEANNISAINTLTVKNNILLGDNTDGIGALNAIEEMASVKNKDIVIIGAGGTARAITFEARKRGARVTILNQSVKNGEKLAEEFDCQFISLVEAEQIIKKSYDIIINTTPVGMQNGVQRLPLSEKNILPHTVLLDMISNPEDTLFLKTGRVKNCQCISGRKAFYYQAIEQERIWGII